MSQALDIRHRDGVTMLYALQFSLEGANQWTRQKHFLDISSAPSTHLCFCRTLWSLSLSMYGSSICSLNKYLVGGEVHTCCGTGAGIRRQPLKAGSVLLPIRGMNSGCRLGMNLSKSSHLASPSFTLSMPRLLWHLSRHLKPLYQMESTQSTLGAS